MMARRGWSVFYGPDVVARALTRRGAERRAARWIRSSGNSVRLPRRGNVRVERTPG